MPYPCLDLLLNYYKLVIFKGHTPGILWQSRVRALLPLQEAQFLSLMRQLGPYSRCGSAVQNTPSHFIICFSHKYIRIHLLHNKIYLHFTLKKVNKTAPLIAFPKNKISIILIHFIETTQPPFFLLSSYVKKMVQFFTHCTYLALCPRKAKWFIY